MRLGRRVADDLADQLLRRRRATSSRSPTSSSALHPGLPGDDLVSAVLPEFREYERTLTACMNSYVRPQVASYVDRLQSSLNDLGVKTEVDILRSDAGVMTPAEAARNPVYGVLSRAVRRRRGRALRGRAGGLPERADVRHGRHVDRRVAVPGGRADDRARDDDRPVPDQGPERRRAHRRRRRRLDRARARSSPARCASARSPRAPSRARRRTGRAATEPTVTDANVVLGHLPADLIGGEMSLDVEAARAAVQKVADAMGLCARGGRRRHPADRQREHGGRAARDLASSAATTRASSRWSPSAAPGRCTPTRSPS